MTLAPPLCLTPCDPAPPLPFPTFPLTSDLLLPFHLIVEIFRLLEEVVHFASLLIPLRRVEHSVLGFPSEELTDVGDREHNLLHCPVVPHNLETVGARFQPFCTPQSQTRFLTSLFLINKFCSLTISCMHIIHFGYSHLHRHPHSHLHPCSRHLAFFFWYVPPSTYTKILTRALCVISGLEQYPADSLADTQLDPTCL